MSDTRTAQASWAVEIDHDGSKKPDYFSIGTIVFDDNGVHIQLEDGTAIEYARGSVRKVLIMRTSEDG